MALLCQLPFLANAAKINGISPELMYDKKPIDSLCFSNISEDHQIYLEKCGAAQEKYTVQPGDADLLNKGYIGYSWKDANVSSDIEGYSYYRYYPAGNNKFWIYSINNGGGSGEFTAIYLVKRKDSNTLSVEDVVAGDRCNGGVYDVTEKNRALTFNASLTAYDLIAYADNKDLASIQAYDDLAACAVCCFASASYTVKSGAKPKLNYINLNDDMQKDDMPDQGKYQICFNQLFASYLDKKEIKLQQGKLASFVKEFKKTCVDEYKATE